MTTRATVRTLKHLDEQINDIRDSLHGSPTRLSEILYYVLEFLTKEELDDVLETIKKAYPVA